MERAYDTDEERLERPDIAVVGMAARLPGASNVSSFWRNIAAGRESIRRLSDDELRSAGVDSATLHDPNYVKAAATLHGLELFDASFFGFSKREASVLDPQHRHFLEICSEALESAGIQPEGFDGSIGVFAGSGMNAYMPFNLFTQPELMRELGLFLVRHTGNDKDFLTTRVSYCLNLKGPSLSVQTACSTSLVAVHLACQSLLSHECDVALAGGVTIELPHYRGYRYEDGEILSPDGHCRPFDAHSKGTVFGSGAGVVVLRRLKDAVESGDYIHAIVKGSAVNNDGRRKVSYLAPSVEGQAHCVVEALAVAGLSAREISYVECHGTGTPLGDAIEMTALHEAFSRTTHDKGYCGVGSVKSNIGHLDTAAGVVGLIKTAQMLEHEVLVPTLHFENPNPEIDFASTPFHVVQEQRSWPRTDTPRRAGVSSIGVGGTNAHVILEEAPRRKPPVSAQRAQLLVLSARSQASLEASAQALGDRLGEDPKLDLADVSSTLLHGRRLFPFRRVLAASNLTEAQGLLTRVDNSRVFDVRAPEQQAPVVFLFPGGGAQYTNMARHVFEDEPVFRACLEECLTILERQERLDVRPFLFPDAAGQEAASRELERPSLALPALLSIEVAYARLLASWGIRPVAMLGHSLGEYAAAHLSGVLSLESTLGIVCCRGRLFEKVTPGGMLSVPLNAETLRPLLGDRVSLAVVNGPGLCVVSGDNVALEELDARLKAQSVEARRLHIQVPAHSPLLDSILDEFGEYLSRIDFGELKIPYLSNLTGRFVRADEATDPSYFVRHLRQTVQFSAGLETLLAAHPDAIVVEVGPGQTLSPLAREHPSRTLRHSVVPLSPHAKDRTNDAVHLVTSMGRILAHGGAVDLDAMSHGAARRIVPLPPTPFEHERHWIEPGNGYFAASDAPDRMARETDVARWFYRPVFREEPRPPSTLVSDEGWIVLVDDGPLGRALLFELRARGVQPTLISPGERSEQVDRDHYTLRLSDPRGYDNALRAIFADKGRPRRILHALCLGERLLTPDAPIDDEGVDRAFFSLLHLAQALSQEELAKDTELLVATSRAFDVAGTSTLCPLHALAQGPVLVIPKEIPEVQARLFDVFDPEDAEATARALVSELAASSDHGIVAERGRARYVQVAERVTAGKEPSVTLPENPVMLFTGGLGGIARTLASHFARTRGARLVLVTRREFPARSSWEAVRAALAPGDPMIEQLETLLALERSGAEVMVEQADVASSEDVRALVLRVRERFGRIDAVIHAAGVLDDGPLAVKERAAVQAVLAPKVRGASNLVEALASDPPALLLLVSSTSAMVGPAGQIDYVAANAYLNAFARKLAAAAPRTSVLSLGFGVWKETGMAARARAPFALGPEGEPSGHPLIDRERIVSPSHREFHSAYTTSRLWALDEHRVRGGTAVLPGTAVLEIARAVGARVFGLGPSDPLEIRDVMFIAPLEVPDGEVRDVRVIVTREAGDENVLSITLTSRKKGDSVPIEHARAVVTRYIGRAPTPLPVADLEARCRARSVEFEEGEQVLPQDQHLSFGPRWRVLRSMCFGNDEALAHLCLPERLRSDLDVYALHPALLDMSSGFAFSLADTSVTSDRFRVPLSYHRVRVFGALAGAVVSYARLKAAPGADGLSVFDVRVADARGRILVEIDGYATKSVSPSVFRGGALAVKEPDPLARWLEQGLSNQDGIDVVEWALRSGTHAELVATPTSLYTMQEDVRAKRPALRSVTVAANVASPGPSECGPRDDIERKLVGMWQSLLGVDAVRIDDNFFELGGHSLIAVRLFSRIKKTYGIELSLAVLFDAPTIERCAVIVRRELGLPLAPAPALAAPVSAGGETPVNSTVKQTFSPLVLIQKGGPRPPFFCVHGAGGNVLNFRDLAQGLGPTQTFFGLQTHGVDGGQALTSIEAMAESYLQEIYRAQPAGPYFLGGYSGGGVVAFELAQRLRRDGHRVALVAFLDTFHPGTIPRGATFNENVAALIEQGPGYLPRKAKSKLSRHLSELSSELKLRFFIGRGLPLPIELRDLHLTRTFLEAAQRYHPRPYDGTVTLFRARKIASAYNHVGPALGWNPLIPKLEIVEVPGDHDSLLLQPNIQVLTAHLRAAIAREVLNGR